MKNVKLGKNCKIGKFVVLGEGGFGRLVIGENANIRSHSVVYSGNKVGRNFQTGHHVMIRECNNIGDNVSIGTHTVVEHHVRIEDNVRIHSQAFVPEFCVLKKGCWIGPNAVLTNVLHPLCPKAKKCVKGAVVGENAKIGANVTLMPDIRIGKNALVGAGSVVVKDVPANKVAVGNPAKVIKDIKDLKCPYNLVERPY